MPPARLEKIYSVVRWSDMPKGGHFAASEEPELMLADLRASITTVSASGRKIAADHFQGASRVDVSDEG